MNETVTITDHATPELRRRIAELKDKKPILSEMGMAVERQVVRHFRTVKMPQGNMLGAPSTGFWQKAMSSVVGTATGDTATVAIKHVGVRLQYLGGPVRPGPGKSWLTIPAVPEAHGKSASEVEGGYENQEWLFDAVSRRPFAIASKASGTILFWLTKKATIKPHPDVLPPEEEIAKTAVKAAKAFLRRGGAR